MLTKEQCEELKEHLLRAQNPVFYYDNDADGLCSFLLLRRFCGKGYGVAVRSYPDLDKGYVKKAIELKADYVFILDKPILSKEFVKGIAELGIPIVWIDHHDVLQEDYSKTYNSFWSYNPSKNTSKDKSSEPVTYISYALTQRKEDLWIAVIGCIADHYLPDFSNEFAEKYREYWSNGIKKPFDAYYKTEIGRIARTLNFGLKDSISNVVKLQKHLLQCKSPEDVLAEVNGNRDFRKKYQELNKKYDSLLEKAERVIEGKVLFFSYGGETSMSADLANELCYKHQNAVIAVAYLNGGIANISIRGKNVRKLLEKILLNFPGSSGGGHDDAVGARINSQDLKRFEEALKQEVKD